MSAFILAECGENDLEAVCQALAAVEWMLIGSSEGHGAPDPQALAALLGLLRERLAAAHAAARFAPELR
jgi:hypothetical protein